MGLQVPVAALLDQRAYLKLAGAREALERALELCDEMEQYVQSRRALIGAALKQFDAWSELRRKIGEVPVAGMRAPSPPGPTRRPVRTKAERSSAAGVRR